MTADAHRIHIRFQRTLPQGALDIALDLPGHGVNALFGPSGAGKTTSLRVLAGLERLPGAYVEVNGEVWQDDARGIYVPVNRRQIGYVFQEASLFPHLSVRQNLEYGLRRRRGLKPVVNFDHAIELLGIGALLERSTDRLSGGERQRVAIARALLAAPRLLLLDEPLAAIDAARKNEILPWLERLRDELVLPMVYVSHSIEEVARLADYVARIDGGRVVAAGALTAVIHELPRLEAEPDDLGGLVSARVVGYDDAYGLLRVAFAGGELQLAHQPMAPGRTLRIRIPARDLSLATTHPVGSSILNVLRARIEGCRSAPESAHVLVDLRVGDSHLVARITRLSWDRLQLVIGGEVWVQVKAAAIVA